MEGVAVHAVDVPAVQVLVSVTVLADHEIARAPAAGLAGVRLPAVTLVVVILKRYLRVAVAGCSNGMFGVLCTIGLAT